MGKGARLEANQKQPRRLRELRGRARNREPSGHWQVSSASVPEGRLWTSGDQPLRMAIAVHS